MKSFLLKFLLFISFCIASIVFYWIVAMSVIDAPFKNDDAIFIWGDSQIYQGLNLDMLQELTGKEVISSAHHGSGVYDFVVFSEKVEPNSTVIVGLSKLVQVRRKDYDYNKSGLSISGLMQLWEHNYSADAVFKVCKKNLRIKNEIVNTVELYSNHDTIKIGLPIEHFESYYSQVPHFLIDKQNIYLAGFRALLDKSCKVIIVEYPFHPILSKIEQASPVFPKTEAFTKNVLALYNITVRDTIALSREQNVFFDLSHLNNLGADKVTRGISSFVKETNSSVFIVVN